MLQKAISPNTLISRMHSIPSVLAPMEEEKKPKTKAQSDQLSNSNTPDEEVDLQLRTSEEKRSYGTIRGSAQATQAALSHSRVQTNPTIEGGPPQRPKIKKLSKDKAAEKGIQTNDNKKRR